MRNPRHRLTRTLLLTLLSLASACAMPCDVHIVGGLVVDGTGAAPRRADVLITDGRIVAVGSPRGVDAKRTIDARGKVVTPGFIDPHAHGDPRRTPGFANFVAMGVTTICLGQDGVSPGGRDFEEWLGIARQGTPRCNIAPFVGHGTLRRLAGIGMDTDPSAAQLDALTALVETAMRAGAFGISFGLEYEPGRFAKATELASVCRVVADHGGVAMAHIRSEDDDAIEAALREFCGACPAWSALGSGLSGTPRALATMPNGDIIAAGEFLAAGGAPANRIARWDGAAWSPLGQGLSGPVWALEPLPNGELLVGGDFLNAGGIWSPFLARWDGTNWSPVAPHTTWYVRAIEVMPNGDIIVGGGFNTAGTVTCNRIARWDGSAWSPLGSGMDQWVHSLLALPNGELVAGGAFASAGGSAISSIARWDGTAWSGLGAGLNRPVIALGRLPNGDLLVGGAFQPTSGFVVQGAVRWDGTAWNELQGPVRGEVRDFALRQDGTLALAGNFHIVDDEVAAYFARLEPTCPATVTAMVTTCTGTLGPVTLTADTLPWLGSTCATTATGFAPNALAVALLGLTSPNVPLTWLPFPALPNCDQLASQEAILLTFAQAGSSSFAFAIPNDPAFAGLPLFHQFLQFEVDAQNNISALSSSNALTLTVGTF